jgi:Uma2 family endonuclease
MSAVQNFVPHYTVADYALWKGDWELWEGYAVAMTPSPFGRHQRLVTRISRLLGNALESVNCSAETLLELDWIVAEDTVVRPDIMVVCGPPPERYLESVPALVVEVLSESTRQHDWNYKRQLYQREGVAFYLIVDPESRSIHVDAKQPDGTYSSTQPDSVLELGLCSDCEIRFAFESLFRR